MVWEEAEGTFGAEAHMAEEARVPDQPKPGLVCCEEAKRHVSRRWPRPPIARALTALSNAEKGLLARPTP